MFAFLLSLLSLSTTASADCASSSWKVWPAANVTLPTNPIFVIQGYGTAQADVLKLATYGPLLDGGEDDHVALTVAQQNVGEKDVTQVLLKPARDLKPGRRYRLRWVNRPADFELEASQVRWDVRASRDDDAPTWTTPPSALKGVEQQFGCGPSRHARLALAVSDAGPFLIAARVTRKGRTVEYLVDLEKDGTLKLGHGMCSGPFVVGDDAWTVQLSAVDVAGHRTPAPGLPLPFKGLDPASR